MGSIVLLDDLTINKIAAGEVIERPASAVKEMVENSIDAGATNIIVEIKNGGITYIRVTDNGKGIANDDFDMAFERHATSKIRSAEDLSTVKSMGFRGEALASISAISKMEMTSKTAEEQTGYKVIVEGGNIIEKTETGAPVGTTIIVTDLFYNTPVRYKFLRKDFTEAGNVEDVITRIALVHPEIAIKLISSGRTVIQTNGNGDLKTVIYSIYGKDVSNAIIDIDYTSEDIHVYGVIGKPEIARSNRAYQMFFINKRYVKDKILSSALEKSYKEQIPAGKFAFAVLSIEMDPRKVDVNVHPAKLEVRFEDENSIFRAVYHAIKEKTAGQVEKSEVANILEAKPFAVKQTETKPFAIRQTEIKPYEIKYEETKPTEVKIEENKPAEIKLEETKPAEVKQEENKPAEIKLEENKPTEVKEKAYDITTDETFLKSQEILKKLQEMKENMLKENPIKSVIVNENLKSEDQTNQTLELENETKNEETIQEPVNEEQINKEEIINEEVINEEQVNKEPVNEEETINKIEEKTEEYKIEEEQKNIIEDIYTAKVEEDFTPEFEEMYLKMFGTKPVKEENEHIEENKEETLDDITQTAENVSLFEQVSEYQKPNYKFIGIAFDKYAIIEMENDVYILNQHSAQERILYETIKNSFNNNSQDYTQLLLIPDIITLSEKEMDILKDNKELIKRIGLEFEDFGENTIKLTEVPEVCADLDTEELFLEILNKINSIARTEKSEIEEKIIEIIASKAVEGLQPVTSKEGVESLMDKLLTLPNPFVSADGTALAVKMSKYDIERKFARK